MEVCSQHSNIVITNRYNRTAQSIEKFCSGCKSIPKEITIIEKKANDNQNLNDTQTFAKNTDKDETVENSEKSKVNINQNINKDKLVCDKHPEQKLTYHLNYSNKLDDEIIDFIIDGTANRLNNDIIIEKDNATREIMNNFNKSIKTDL